MTIAEAVQDLHRRASWKPNAAVRGPVPLNRFLQEVALEHFALSQLSTKSVAETLIAERIVSGPSSVAELLERNDKLDGFLFTAGGRAFAFVDADAPIGRRRFTAAHELGHRMLHRDKMGAQLAETNMEKFDAKLGPMEIEANKFAAELLMPEVVLRARAAALESETRRCPRSVLVYQLAGEMLVSPEAMKYRLTTLGIGDE